MADNINSNNRIDNTVNLQTQKMQKVIDLSNYFASHDKLLTLPANNTRSRFNSRTMFRKRVISARVLDIETKLIVFNTTFVMSLKNIKLTKKIISK